MDKEGYKQFIKFCLVGTIGFLVDYSVLLLLSHIMGYYISRVFSFSTALYVTWKLNSTLTFAEAGRDRFYKYIISSVIGGAINYLVYVFFIKSLPSKSIFDILLAVGSGSIVGLFFNFAMSKFYIFAKKREW